MFKLTVNGRDTISQTIGHAGDMMYGRKGKFNDLHKKHKDLIDIRLD